MKYSAILILVLILSVVGCKKMSEPLVWDSDYTFPLVKGSLGVEDLVPDSLVSVDVDSSIVLSFEGNLLDMDLSEIIALPDTIIRDTFQVPFPTPIDFSPGQVFLNVPEEQNIQLSGIFLKGAKIESGVVEYELTSTVQGEVIYTYEIPSATNWTGSSFSKSITVPAAPSGSLSSVSGSFDLDGYYLDMTGQNGVDFNIIETNINCKIAESNAADVSVSSADVIMINNEFKEIVIEQAEGYFGQHSVSTGLDYVTLDGFQNWVSGAIDIEELNVEMALQNGLGVDIFITLNELIAEGGTSSVSLYHDILGELISMARATRYYDSVVPTTYAVDIDQYNSNIDDFLETLPHRVGYDLDIEVNPLGNVSGYNDFYYKNAPIGVLINATMPLSVIADDLTLEDTLEISIAEDSPLNVLTLEIEVENGFPLEADIEIGVLDQNDKIISRIFAPTTIEAASLGADGKVSQSSSSVHELNLNNLDLNRIESNGRVVLTVVFNTPTNDHVTIYNSSQLNYIVRANANITISTSNE